MSVPVNLFWDSCVFIAYLVGDTGNPRYLDICQFVEDAKRGERRIHFSTLVFAELRQEFFKSGDYGNVTELFADLGSNFYPIDPSPNILIATGELRSAQSTNPGDPNPPKQRAIGTPDAVHLMTCLYTRDVLGVSDIVFHTFDRGKGTGWEGRTVPIIGFEKWFPVPTRTDRVKAVCSLVRSEPIHDAPTFDGVVIRGRFSQP